MTLTYRGSVVARSIRNFIDANKESFGVKAVYYGDQDTFPTNPSVCVEPSTTVREIEGSAFTTRNTFLVNILVYHTSLSGNTIIQEECDNISELIQDAVNKESITPIHGGGTQFGGIIVSGHVARLEYGYRLLADKLMRCNRLIWQGMTKTHMSD